MKRISVIEHIHITGTAHSSIVQIGDNCSIEPKSNVFAEQKQIPTFLNQNEDEPSLEPIPQPVLYESVSTQLNNVSPWIHVGLVDIEAISLSSVFQAGSNEKIEAVARVKHVRRFVTK